MLIVKEEKCHGCYSLRPDMKGWLPECSTKLNWKEIWNKNYRVLTKEEKFKFTNVADKIKQVIFSKSSWENKSTNHCSLHRPTISRHEIKLFWEKCQNNWTIKRFVSFWPLVIKVRQWKTGKGKLIQFSSFQWCFNLTMTLKNIRPSPLTSN